MPCVILSGGRGSRIGQLKQNLTIADSTLANFMAEKFQKCFTQIYFSAKTRIPNDFQVQTILDSIGDGGDLSAKENFAPIFGLKSLLEFLKCDAFVLSIDTPCFECTSAQELVALYQKNKNPTFAKNSKIHPLLGIYPYKALAKINAQLKARDYKLLHLLERINAEFVEISTEKTQNLNTYGDYEMFCQNLKAL